MKIHKLRLVLECVGLATEVIRLVLVLLNMAINYTRSNNEGSLVQSKWSTKFEIKPGRWVFVPTDASRVKGLEIKQYFEEHWTAPAYYYHLHRGGHVAAVKAHLDRESFLHLDVQDFFGSIGRSRVTRCLKQLLSYEKARHWAMESTVRHPVDPTRTIIPYGFIQSQILASICLRESALGRYLHGLSSSKDCIVSVYVDDVIVSAAEKATLITIQQDIVQQAKRSRFELTATIPENSVEAFNIRIAHQSMAISDERLHRFRESMAADCSEAKRNGIVSYVASVSESQAEEFRSDIG